MLRLSANISTLFTELPLVQRFAAAARAGFAAVEIQFPYDVPAGELADARTAANVEVVLINMPAGRLDRGDLGIACRPERQAEFARAIEQAIHYGDALDCRRVNCLAGRADADSRPMAWRHLRANLSLAASAFEERGIRLLVESLNRHDNPGFLLDSMAATDEILEDVAHPNLALQYDIYHAHANGEDWLDGIVSRLDRIAHIQFSDFPGRGPPGTGVIDFAAFFEMIRRLPYAGWTGCEYRPVGPSGAGPDWREKFDLGERVSC